MAFLPGKDVTQQCKEQHDWHEMQKIYNASNSGSIIIHYDTCIIFFNFIEVVKSLMENSYILKFLFLVNNRNKSFEFPFYR